MGNTFSLCSLCASQSSPAHVIALRNTEMTQSDAEDKTDDLWLKHFQIQSKTLQKKHLWAKKLPAKLKKFKCPMPRKFYLSSILSLSQTYQVLTQGSGNLSQSIEYDENKQKGLRTSSYENNSFISTMPRKNEDGVSLYKSITSSIEKHLKDSQNNHLAYLLGEFIDWFYETYKKVLILENKRGLEKQSFEKSYKMSIENLQQFIRVFAETLMIFYQIDRISNNGKFPVFSKENFINFITSFLFSYDKIYQIVFFMQKAMDQAIEQKFQMILGLKDTFEISDYLIPNKLCVFTETRKSHKTKKLSNDLTFFSFSSEFETPNRTFCYQDNFKHPQEFESFHSFQQEDFYLERFNSFDDLNVRKPTRGGPLDMENTFLSAEESEFGSHFNKPVYHYKRKALIKNEEKKENLTKFNVSFIPIEQKPKPYADAIKILEELHEIRSPVHKMKKILMMISQIMRNIGSLSESGIESEALDQKYLFCILLYIVIQSHCTDLHSQLKMIEKFSTNNVLASVSGYYFTLLQLVLKFFEGIDHEILLGEDRKAYLKDRIEEALIDFKRNILF